MKIAVIFLDAFIGWAFVSLCTWHSLAAFRRSQHAHWSVRANLLRPALTGTRLSLLLVPAIIGFLQPHVFDLSFAVNWTGAAASFVGAVLGTFWFDRSVFPDISFQKWWFHSLVAKFQLLLFITSFLFALKFMPSEPGLRMALVTIIFFAVQTTLLLSIGKGRINSLGVDEPVGERFRLLATAACEEAGSPTPRLRQLKNSYAQAWALILRNEIAITDGLLNACTDAEVKAVIHHELTHLSEPRSATALRVLASYQFAPLIFIGPLEHWLSSLGVLLPFGIVYMIVHLHTNLQRRLELKADAMASKMATGPDVYASALYKIHRTNLMPAMNPSGRASHPDLYDRMLSAGVEPDFPKPTRPDGLTGFWVLAWTGLIVLLMLLSIPKMITKVNEHFNASRRTFEMREDTVLVPLRQE